MEKLIYNFFNKTKGVVSVFLVIILVPVVTACSLYVDACRIKLAKSVIESSGDLALNTVLSSFDADLAEIYGLMASCQKDEITATAKEYFKKSMISAGMEEKYADRYSNYISGLIDGEDDFSEINDLIGIETNSVEINPVENGNLANAAILESQIVEFMKYRAPIEAVTDLFNKFSQIKDQCDNSKKEAKLVSDMSEYCESQKNALEKLEEAYKNILYYNNLKITESYVNEIKNKLSSTGDSSIRSDYKKSHIYLVKDLDTYTTYNTPLFNKTDIKSPGSIVFNNNTTLSANNFETKMKALQSSISTYYTRYNTLNNKLASFNSNGKYQPQYWIQMDKAVRNDNVLSNFIAIANGSNSSSVAYKMAELNYYKGKDSANETDTEVTLNQLSNVSVYGTDTIANHINNFNIQVNSLYSNSSNTQPNLYLYNTVTNELVSLSNTWKSQLDNEKAEINNKTSSISSELNEYDAKLSSADNYLKKAKENLKDAKDNLENMKNSFDSWTEDLNDSEFVNSSDLAENNKGNEYAEAKKAMDDGTLSAESVDALSDRLNNIKSLLGSLKSAIGKLKYQSTNVKDIKSFDDFKNASKVNINKITMIESELKQYAEESFSFTNPDVSNISVSQNNNPNLETNKLKLYKWMQDTLKDPRKEDPEREKKEDDYNSRKQEKENKAKVEDAKNDAASKNEISGDNLPSKGKSNNMGGEVTDDVTNVAAFVGNFFKEFGDLKSVRDDLYLLYYINHMFTYDTFDKEIKYNADGEEEDKYARATLTNVTMNSENNYSYLNEIEYIIYGNKSISDNKNSVYGTIFAVRYALNLAYAFSHFWFGNNSTANSINAIAEGIAAATCGVIPIPLTKLVIILGLVTGESACDIVHLRNGEPVILFKTDKTWQCQLDSDAANAYSEESRGNALAFQYSDYLNLILFMSILGNKENIVLRTADVIQCNMGIKNDGFALSKSNVYYKLTANCKNSILMLALPVIQGTLKEGNISVNKWNEYSITLYRGY